MVVKGKNEPIGVHEVLDYHNDKTFPNLMDVVNHFNEGRKHYKSGSFEQAISSFNECQKQILKTTYQKHTLRDAIY